MGSSTAMPIWALTTQHSYLHSWPIAQHNSSKSNRSYAIHCCLGQCVFPPLCSGSETGFSNNLTVLYLPPYSPFLTPIEEFFSHAGGEVEGIWSPSPGLRYTLIHGHGGVPCWQMEGRSNCEGWIRSFKTFSSKVSCLMTHCCDVDEILWPDPVGERDNV